MEMTKSIIIDGNAFINVFYRATLPDIAKNAENPDAPEYYQYIKKNSQGYCVNSLRLFTKYLALLINTFKPTKLAVCFDVPGGSQFRKDIYPEYKGNRGEKPKPLIEQIDTCKWWLSQCNIPVYADGRVEADDIICSLRSKQMARDTQVIVVTTDHDYYQMVNEKVHALMYIPNAKKFEQLKQKYPNNCMNNAHFCLYDENMIKAETGVYPFQIPDLKGLCGDVSDNIPKVPGIGDKTATQLLTMYTTVEQIVEAVETHDTDILAEIWKAYPGVNVRGAAKIIESIRENSRELLMSKKLATTLSNVPICEIQNLNINTIEWQNFLDFTKSQN